MLEKKFPNLKKDGYSITSPASSVYNCIAWAADENDKWWWPDDDGFGYWPESVPREETIAAFIIAFETIGYALCDDWINEEGFEKVALYAKQHKPTHAARQLNNGLWTSKLGQEEDIEHHLAGIQGDVYGEVVAIMKRQSSK